MQRQKIRFYARYSPVANLQVTNVYRVNIILSKEKTCCDWAPCFLFSRPFRSLDEFSFFFCTKLLDISVGAIHTK